MMLESIRYVDLVIPEKGWGQKEDDVEKFDVDVFVMGHDWEGEFDFLKDKCEVIYLNVQKAFRRLKSNKNYMVKMLNKLYRTIDTKR